MRIAVSDGPGGAFFVHLVSYDRRGGPKMIHSAEEFVMLRSSDDVQEYLRAVTDSAPIEVWQAVVCGHPEMRCRVAQNKTVPLVVLEALADDPDEDVRAAVAMKNKLTTDLFTKLAADFSDDVRARIAYNRNTPTEVLLSLASDCCPLVADAARSRLK